MSSPPATHDRRTSSAPTAASDGQDSQGALERLSPRIAKPIRVASFWTAIALPFLHVPLLATGLSTAPETATFLGLLVLNLLALYLGHSHRT